jgi:hypothetical protein
MKKEKEKIERKNGKKKRKTPNFLSLKNPGSHLFQVSEPTLYPAIYIR